MRCFETILCLICNWYEMNENDLFRTITKCSDPSVNSFEFPEFGEMY